MGRTALPWPPTEWPWTYVGIICSHGMFAAAGGVDNLVRVQPLATLWGDRLVTRNYAPAS